MAYRLEARYTGTGPNSGQWLPATAHGFLVNDKPKTLDEAKAEAKRLRATHPRFLDRASDWELRAVDLEVQAPEPRPAPAPRLSKKTRKAKRSKG